MTSIKWKIPVMLAAVSAAFAVQSSAPAQTLGVATQVLGAPGETFRIDLSGGDRTQDLVVPRGKSTTLKFSGDVRTAHVTSDAIAGIETLTPGQFIISGRTPGQTDARFYDASGRTILTLNIRVDMDVSAITETIARNVPNAQVHLEAINNSVVMTGRVESADDANAAVLIAAAAVGKDNVINRLVLAGKDQVMLRVQIVQVQTTEMKQLGFDTAALLGTGRDTYTIANNSTFSVNSGYQGGGSLRTNYVNGAETASATIRAFERNGLMRTVAEPNATVVSGEAASFKSGGQFPVPTGRDRDGMVTIEYKDYGIALGFTPVVLNGGNISIKMEAELSDLSTQGAQTLTSNGGSTTVPGLIRQKTSTTVELPSGGSRMVSGLVMNTTRQNIDRIPGIGDLPFIGALGRSRDMLSTQTELVFIVTAYIVDPANPNQLQTPADGLRIADDAQTLLLGRLNKTYRAPAAATEGRTYQGPFGHVIE